MKYHLAQKLIRTGDLLAFKGTWFMSRAIQWITGSEISHVGIACWVSFNGHPPQLCMFESMEGSDVHIMPLYKTLERYYWSKEGAKVYWKSLKPEYNGKDIMDFCVEHWCDAYASPYQFLVIASPKLRWLRSLIGKSTDIGNNQFHCSELIACSVRDQGYELPKRPELVTPGDVYGFNCFNDVGIELEYSSKKQVFGDKCKL